MGQEDLGILEGPRTALAPPAPWAPKHMADTLMQPL